jgi:hypothetical protein
MSFIKIASETRFSAHQEMCQHIESLDDNVIDYSFRGRHNWLLMETKEGVRYVLYVFVVCPEGKWLIKMITEGEFIPAIDCPERLVKQSTLDNEVASAWRKQVTEYWVMRSLEMESIKNENAQRCNSCRVKQALNESA